MLKKLSIKKKLFFLIITVFVFSITVAALYARISFLNSSKKVSASIVKVINKSYSEKVETELQRGFAMLNSLVTNLQIEKKGTQIHLNNSNLNSIRKYIIENEDILNFYLILNNRFKYQKSNISFNNDTLQSYSFSLNKTKKGISSTIFDEAYYRINFQEIIDVNTNNYINISEPFIVNAQDNLLGVTISKPILQNGKLIGFAGINFSLSQIVNIINSIKQYEEGAKTILISENGIVIFASDKPWLSGKNINYSHTDEQELFLSIKNNEFNNIGVGGFAGAITNLNIKNSNTKWQLVTIISNNVFIAELISEIYISIIIASIIMILGLFIGMYFINKSFLPIKAIIEASNKITKGELISLPESNFNTDFGEIAKNLNLVSSKLKEAADVGNQIAKGNYNISISQKSENDILSISINKIAKNLKEAEQNKHLKDENTHKQLWMRKGRFEVAEAERKSENNISDLTFNILREIANYTGAILGGIYLHNSEKEVIELVASYAYENKKQTRRSFKSGEGLIGACVVEKKKIILNEVPDDYIKIVSGLGSGKPSGIIIIPIFYQEKINSVIELAFVKQPENYVIEFIEQLGDNIGAWIDASLIASKTAKLLQVSREQTKKLAEKENELNVKVEELQKIKAEIDIQNVEYKSMMNAINHTVMAVQYTLDGIVINSNTRYEEIMGYKSEDIIGTDVFYLVKEQKEDLRHIIKEVSEGKAVKRQVKRFTKGGEEKWFSATYTPFYNKEGKITRVLFFAHDITDLKDEIEGMKK